MEIEINKENFVMIYRKEIKAGYGKYGSHYWYFKPAKEYILMFRKAVIYEIEEVAVGYCGLKSGNYVLCKHGESEAVQKWFSDTGKALRKFGKIKDFADYAVVTSDQWDVEELNKLIHEDGYMKVFMNSQNSKFIEKLVKKAD